MVIDAFNVHFTLFGCLFFDDLLLLYFYFSIKTTIGSAESADFGVITEKDITFDPGENSKTVEIQISNDGIVENDESFTVSLETTHPRVQFNRREASVKIIDDDSKYYSFAYKKTLHLEHKNTIYLVVVREKTHSNY